MFRDLLFLDSFLLGSTSSPGHSPALRLAFLTLWVWFEPSFLFDSSPWGTAVQPGRRVLSCVWLMRGQFSRWAAVLLSSVFSCGDQSERPVSLSVCKALFPRISDGARGWRGSARLALPRACPGDPVDCRLSSTRGALLLIFYIHLQCSVFVISLLLAHCGYM